MSGQRELPGREAAAGVTGAAELAAFELRRGRGYRRGDVDAFRAAALGLAEDLEALVGSLQRQVVDAQQTLEAAEGSTVEQVLARVSPEQLRRAGAAAAGDAVVAGVETARAMVARARAAMDAQRQGLVDAVAAIEDLVAAGRRPDADLEHLAELAVRARAALAGGAAPPQAPSEDAVARGAGV